MLRRRSSVRRHNNIETIGDLTYCFSDEEKLKFIDFLKSVDVKDGERKKIDDVIQDINDRMKFEEKLRKAAEAAENGKTTIPEEDWGVHIGHCCVDHGCKYGEVDCPVSLDLVEQNRDCEYCFMEDETDEEHRNYKPRERKRRQNN